MIPHLPTCGDFANSVTVALRPHPVKISTNCDAHLAESLFSTP
ncbi:MAG: DUF6783 domain-containing protein [Ruminococcus sp.]